MRRLICRAKKVKARKFSGTFLQSQDQAEPGLWRPPPPIHIPAPLQGPLDPWGELSRAVLCWPAGEKFLPRGPC